MSYSPAQMLMSRVLNSTIPIVPALLEPKVVDPRPQLEQRQRRHKAVFDRGARELTKLRTGERVRTRHNHVWLTWSERMATLGRTSSSGAERNIDVTDEIYCKLLKSCRETTTRSTTRSLMRHQHHKSVSFQSLHSLSHAKPRQHSYLSAIAKYTDYVCE